MVRLYIYSVFTALFIILQTGCGKKEKSEKPQSGQKQIAQVEGFVLQPRKMANVVRTTGTIRAFEEVELHPETSGRITDIYFREGSNVSKGQLLVKIYDQDLRAQLKKTESQLKIAKDQLGRQDQLLKISATSQQEYDIVAGQVSSLEAERDIILSSIGKTELRAPFDGMIGLRYISVGSYVTPATGIAFIHDIDPVKIDFSIPEKYAGLVRKDDEVKFTAGDKQFTGKVYAIEPGVDVTRTLKIRAISENSKGNLVPGTFVKVDLNLKEIDNALMVPTQAVIPVLKGQNIYIARNGKAESVAVKTGTRTDKEVQITEGLNAGDTVLTKGIISLKPNAAVNVKLITEQKATY